jgi:hypothetical protein
MNGRFRLATLCQCSHGRRIVAFYRLLKFFFRDIGDAESCLALTLRHARFGCDVLSGWNFRVRAVPNVLVGTLSRLNLFQKLAASADSSRLDTIGHLAKFVIFSLARIASYCLSFVCPLLALVEFGAFAQCNFGRFISGRQFCRGNGGQHYRISLMANFTIAPSLCRRCVCDVKEAVRRDRAVCEARNAFD